MPSPQSRSHPRWSGLLFLLTLLGFSQLLALLQAGAAPVRSAAPALPVLARLAPLGPLQTGTQTLELAAQPPAAPEGEAAPALPALPALAAGPGGGGGKPVPRLAEVRPTGSAPRLTLKENRPLAPAGPHPGAHAVASPGVAGHAQNRLAVGNGYLAYSTNGGVTYRYADPRVSPAPPAGQVFAGGTAVEYVPALSSYVWVFSYHPAGDPHGAGSLRLCLATDAELQAGTVRTVELHGLSLGLPGSALAAPELTASGGSLYLTVRTAVGTTPGSALVRLTLADLQAGAFTHSGVLATSQLSHMKVAQGAGSRGYVAALTSRSSLQVLVLDEGDDAVRGTTLAVTPFNAGPYVSELPDGGNWLARAETRIEGAAVAGGELWLAWTAGPEPAAGYPHPYVRLARVETGRLSLAGESGLAFTETAAALPELAATPSGEVGVIFAAAGGGHFPSSVVGLLTGGVEFKPLAEGVAGTGNLGFGDRLSIRALGTGFLASGYRLAAAGVEPRIARFDRSSGLGAQSSGPYSVSGTVTRRGVGESGVTVSLTETQVFSTSPNTSVPDDNTTGITSTLQVVGTGTINSLSVAIRIPHTYIGDLEVRLTHPDGTSRYLHEFTGADANNLYRVYPVPDTPSESLDVFLGKAVAGTWSLRVRDLAGGDTGRLESWSLTFGADGAPATATTDAQGDYLFPDVGNGSYRVVPSGGGREFRPESEEILVNGAPVVDVDFEVKVPPRISGTVLRGAVPESGVEVSLLAEGSEFRSDQGRPRIPIPAYGNGSASLTLGGSGRVFSAYVFADLDMADSDLAAAYLVHPDGTAVRLDDLLFFGEAFDSSLMGKSIAGEWKLEVYDFSGGGGFLDDWYLEVAEAEEVATTVTGSLGEYQFEPEPLSIYYVVPRKSASFFDPSRHEVALGDEDVADQDFQIAALRAISGRVTANGSGMAGVRISTEDPFGNAHSVYSDDDGDFLFSALPEGAYELQPEFASFAFTPPSRNATLSGANATGQDFALVPGLVSGQVTRAGTGESGVGVSLLGAGNTFLSGEAPTDFTLPDGGEVHSPLTLSGPGRIFAGYVTADIDAFDPDFMEAFLVAPDGSTETLEDLLYSGEDFVTGLVGKTAAGTYTLVVVDFGSGSSSTLSEWTLDIVTAEELVATTTDGSGNYQFSLSQPGYFVVVPQAPNSLFFPSLLEVDFVGEDASGLDFEIATIRSLSGRVTGGGNGVPGVTISTTDPYGNAFESVTGSNGEYRFPILPEGDYEVTASYGDFTLMPAVREVMLSGADAVDQDFVLQPAQIRGRVTRGANGEAGVPISLLGEGTNKLSGEATRAVPIPESGAAHSTITLPGTGRAFRVVVTANIEHPDPDFIAVQLEAPDGTIVDLDDLPYSGVEESDAIGGVLTAGAWKLRVFDLASGYSGVLDGWSLEVVEAVEVASTTTTGDGTYLFELFAVGDFVLRPHQAGSAFLPERLLVDVTGEEITDQDFEIAAARAISGRVTSAGAGLPGAEVHAADALGNIYVARTNADGTYQFPALPEGEYDLNAAFSGFSFLPDLRSVTLAGMDVSGQDFELDSSFIRGQVTRDGNPESGVAVSLLRDTGESVAGESQPFEILPGDGSLLSPITIQGSGTVLRVLVRAEIEHDDPGSIEAYLIQPDGTRNYISDLATNGAAFITSNLAGKAAAGTWHLLLFEGGSVDGLLASWGLEIQTGEEVASTTTGVDGMYHFELREPGTFGIVPAKSGLAFSPNSYSVRFAGEDETGYDFEAFESHSLSGRITAAGNGVSGIRLHLEDESGDEYGAVTDATGNFRFPALPDGEYLLVPLHSDYAFSPDVREIEIDGDDVTGADFTVSTRRVSGRVTQGGVGVSGVTITAVPGNAAAATDAEGRYHLDLPPGRHTLVPAISGGTFTPLVRNITLVSRDLAGQDFTVSGASTPTGYRVSGRVSSGGEGVAGVTVTMSPGGRTATTDAEGIYGFDGVANGSYTLTPAQVGQVFAPVNRSVTVNGAAVPGQNFTVGAYTIAGRVTRNGAGEGGVTLTLNPGGRTLATDANGQFSFTGVAPGSYTLTPSKSGLSFSPASRTPQVTTADVTGQDFAVDTYPISGRVTRGASGESGVTITAQPGGLTAVSDGSGNYTLTGLIPGSYTLTPSKSGLSFTPASQSAQVTNAAVTGRNFAVVTAAIRGRVLRGAAAESGVTVTVQPGGQTATTDATGNYTISGLAAGSYTVAASKSGLTFTPASRALNLGASDATGQDFNVVTYGIRGRVLRSGQPEAGVTLTATPGDVTAVTDAQGRYALLGLVNGTYSVAPTKTGLTFSPVSRSLTVNGGDLGGQDFHVRTYTVSGRVTRAGSGESGVRITLNPGSRTLDTADDGTFSFSEVAPGSYTLTAGKSGLTFGPASRTPVVTAFDLPNQDFAVVTYGLSGRVTVGGAGLNGVTVNLSPTGATASTNASGDYAFAGLVNGVYRVTPVRAGVTFTPAERSATLNGGDVTGQDFAAAVTQVPAFRLGDGRAGPAESAVLPLTYVTNGAQIRSATFDLVYDPAVVSFTSVAPGSLPAGMNLVVEAQGAGRTRLRFTGGTGNLAGGTLAHVTFQAAAVAPIGTRASIQVVQPGTSTAGAEVTDATGLVYPATAAPGAVTVARKADLNHDGKIDAGDVGALIKVILGQVPADPSQHDFNGDGRVDVADLQILIDRILGRPNTGISSQATVAGSFTLGSATSPAGSSISLPLTYAAQGGQVSVAVTDLTFDSQKLTFQGASAGTVPSGVVAMTHPISAGRVRLLLVGLSNTTPLSSGTVATVVFGIAGNAVAGSKQTVALALPDTATAGVNVSSPGGASGEAAGSPGTVTVGGVTGKMKVSPVKLTFGTVTGKKTVTKTFKVTNGGTVPLEVTVGTANAPFSVTEGAGTRVLAPRAFVTVKVLYAPTAAGSHTGVIRVTGSDSALPSVDVTLSGARR